MQSPVRGLRMVWQNEVWSVFVVVVSPGIAPGAEVLRSDRTELVVRATAAEQVTLAVRWSRWLSVSGGACLTQHGKRAALVFDGPATVTVTSSLRPSGHC